MRTCQHCAVRIALRQDGVWVHVDTRARYCSSGPVPRPAAAPLPDPDLGGDERPAPGLG
jgi:hypothetical protein